MSVLNFIRKLSKQNFFFFFCCAFLLLLFTNILISHFYPLGTTNTTFNQIERYGKIATVLIVALWAPAFETFLYQTIIIHLVKAFVPKIRFSFPLAIAISALVFGMSHPYSKAYLIAAIIAGIILSSVYFITLYRKQSAFLLVFSLHALNNFLGLIVFFLHK